MPSALLANASVRCTDWSTAPASPAAKGPRPQRAAQSDSFSRIVGINLIGSFNMLRLAAEAMAENAPDEGGERGAIINTASIAAFDGRSARPPMPRPRAVWSA